LNRLFVAMVRAAGVPASLIWVPDRSEQAFLKDYLSTDQLDGEIAIVQLDGKEFFLDPGTKFCPYGTIDWRYSSAMGLRQAGDGAEISETPPLGYKQSLITRKAELSLDEEGVLTGTVSLVLKGVPGMISRQAAERADAASRKELLEADLSGVFRGRRDAELLNSPDWNDLDAPLIAQFRVKLRLQVAGPREFMLPGNLLQAGETPLFPDSSRTSAIDFRYPWQEADEIRVTLPMGVQLGKMPSDDSLNLAYARYRVQHKLEPNNTLYARRDFIMATGLLLPEKYSEVRAFYDQINADDNQATMLKLASDSAKN
jgi:hypothetical protein